jgi:hypothetical protein
LGGAQGGGIDTAVLRIKKDRSMGEAALSPNLH